MPGKLLCVVKDGNGYCSNCGHMLLPGVGRLCAGPPPGLGDRVAAGLATIGITKERVEAVVGGPCGCDGRQAAMNAAGAKYFGLPPGSTAPENEG
jgi:hypothetical protein